MIFLNNKKIKKSIRRYKKCPKILQNSRKVKDAPNFYESIVKFRRASENNFEKTLSFRTLVTIAVAFFVILNRILDYRKFKFGISYRFS